MIKVKVTTKDDGFLDIQAEGHGDPRVCASVSTLMQSNVRFMQELAKQFPKDIQVEVSKK